MIGRTLGSYEVVAKLGEGGMGEVYRARDTKLDRDVALKFLPSSFASDPDRLMRFEREAKTLAALNHPNIAAIYGIEEAAGVRALVMELVDGRDLSELIAGGAEAPRIPLDEALSIAKQIASALEAAHEQGIIHRDLKPANVKVREDGTVKVLDFGLAKAMDPTAGASSPDAMNSPTMTSPALTQMGVILGTAAYMAPEQARGKTVDRRADIWAFGVILHEMLTGRRLYARDEVSDTLAAVLTVEPDLALLPPSTPPSVRRLLARCLAKDRRQRLDSMAAARLELEDAAAPDGQVGPSAGTQPSRRLLLVAVIATAIVAAGIAGAVVWRGTRPGPSPVVRLTVTPTPDLPIAIETNHGDIVITPDGSRILYFSQIGEEHRLAVRPLNSFDPILLEGLGERPRGMSVSPDGQWVSFQSGPPGGNPATLSKVPIAGGAPTVLCSTQGNLRGTTWLTNDTIVFATASREHGLLRVPASGGTAEALTEPRAEDGESDHLWPSALPDGRHVLFSIRRGFGEGWDIALLDVEARTWRVLLEDGVAPQYSPTGHIVFGAGSVLKAVPFDPARLQVTGEPVQVLAGVTMKESGAADFALSGNGTLVYLPGQVESLRTQLAWRDSSGRDAPLAVPPNDYSDLQVSPDGRLAIAVAGMRSGANDGELWLIDLGREIANRLTPVGVSASSPTWSPDSRRVAFWSRGRSSENEASGIFVVSTAGTTAPERLTNAPSGEFEGPASWTRDDRLLFTSYSAGRRVAAQIMEVSTATGETRPLVVGPPAALQAAVSPDGRWLAYTEIDEARRVFVRPFPNVNDVKIPVTSEASFAPAWSADGRTLYYTSGQGYFSVSIRPEAGTLAIGRPTTLSGLPESVVTGSVALPPVGNRFLVAKRLDPVTQAAEYRVVLNWTEELKTLAPATKQ